MSSSDSDQHYDPWATFQGAHRRPLTEVDISEEDADVAVQPRTTNPDKE